MCKYSNLSTVYDLSTLVTCSKGEFRCKFGESPNSFQGGSSQHEMA